MVRRTSPGNRLAQGLRHRVTPGCMLVMVAALLGGVHSPSGASAATEPRHPFAAHTFMRAAESIQPDNVSRAHLDEATAAFYRAWKTRYLVNGCGADRYYVFVGADRTAGRGGSASISFSEGHGYGMIITALMAGVDPHAQTYFDGLYRFFKDHPSEVSPHLMAWNQVRGCGNLPDDGADSAADGDLDVAYALILADRQWGSAGPINYLQEAVQVIAAIRQKELNPQTSTVLMGGFAGTSPQYYYGTRSSDFMPDHFRAFQAVTQDTAWMRAVDAGYGLITTVQTHFSPTAGLLPDFIEATNTAPRPARPDYLEGRGDGHYSYNACRVPWRLGTDYFVSGDARALRTLKPINAWIRKTTGGDPARIYDGYDLKGTPVSHDTSLAFVAPFAVAATVSSENQQWLNTLWRVVAQTPLEASDYYGNTIKLLSMIVVSGNWWAP